MPGPYQGAGHFLTVHRRVEVAARSAMQAAAVLSSGGCSRIKADKRLPAEQAKKIDGRRRPA